MLLDTDVMIDVLRGHPPAIGWLAGQGTTLVGLPGLVAMELLQGCQNLSDPQRLEKQLLRFVLHWPRPEPTWQSITSPIRNGPRSLPIRFAPRIGGRFFFA